MKPRTKKKIAITIARTLATSLYIGFGVMMWVGIFHAWGTSYWVGLPIWAFVMWIFLFGPFEDEPEIDGLQKLILWRNMPSYDEYDNED